MRKKVSKFIAVLFILATTLGGAVSGFAAAPGIGNLHIHKYWVDNDNPHPSNANDGTVQNGITNPPVSDVGFDVYKIGDLETIDGTPADAVKKEQHAVPQGGDGWMYSKNAAGKLEVSDGNTTYVYTLGENKNDGNGVTSATGELTFTGLSKDYYFVEENLTYGTPKVAGKEVDISSKVKPFIVAVPMTNPSGNDWLKDVHVYPKNEGLNPEKKPEVPSVNVGDEVKWSVTANLPTDFSDYKTFRVVDELDEKLNFVTDSVEVFGTNADGTSIVETLDGTNAPLDFKVTATAANPPTTKEKIVIELTSEGIAKLANNANAVKIRIDFKTKVNSKINDVEKNEVTNTATIEYENTTTPDGEKETPPTPPTKVNTGKITIKKQDQDGAPLGGATFKLYYLESSDKYYIYKNAANEIKAVKDEENPQIPAGYSLYEVTSDDSTGLATFAGLKTHKDETTEMEYYIEETKAPSGYNLLQDPVKVSFADEDTNHVVTKEILNKKGFTLPKTGGIGTMILVVIGIVLIGLAIILTMNKKKKAV